MPDDFPACWDKVWLKGEAILQVQQVINDERKQTHAVWVVLEVTEAALDVICMEHNITVWICAAQVVHLFVESRLDLPKFTVRLSE